MVRPSTNGSGTARPLVVDVVETLETCGLDREEYRLYDVVDVEALERVLNSCMSAEVAFSVEGVRLAVTADGVDILDSEEACSADQ